LVMKTPLNLLVALSLTLAGVTQVSAQGVEDLLREAQQAYVRGDATAAKEKFEMIRRIDPDNRTAINYLRRIIAEEAKNPNKDLTNGTQATLSKVILPKLDFREASLAEALDFLRQKGNQVAGGKVAGGKVAINFVLQIDEAAKAKKVTLTLQNVPFTEALRYIGELTGVQFVYERFAIAVKPKGAAEPGPAATNTPPAKTRPKIEGLN
jgi:hypothetical protein